MALNFPDTPSSGDLFSDGIRKWQYDGAKWILVASDGITGSPGSTGATGPAARRNFVHNGAFDVFQRGTVTQTDAALADAYTADRWQMLVSSSTGGTGVRSASQSTDVPAGYGFGFSLLATITTTLSSARVTYWSQKIEGYDYRKIAGRTVTLSFWMKATNAGQDITMQIIGGSTVTYTWTAASSTAWTKYTCTVTAPATANVNFTTGIGAYLLIFPHGGTNNNGGTTVYITGMQLELGTVATDYELLPYPDVFQTCQRYFQRYVGNEWWASGQCFGGTSAYAGMVLPTVMRAAPTPSFSAASTFAGYGDGGANNVLTAISGLTAGPANIAFNCTLTTARTAGGALFLSSGTVSLSAEL